jgi:hypothetical protein
LILPRSEQYSPFWLLLPKMTVKWSSHVIYYAVHTNKPRNPQNILSLSNAEISFSENQFFEILMIERGFWPKYLTVVYVLWWFLGEGRKIRRPENDNLQVGGRENCPNWWT